MMDPYVRKARIVNVVDGDTVDAVIDLGFHVSITHRLRLAHVDTPEKGQPGYQEAKDFTHDTLINREVYIRSTKDDKYGRYIAEIILEDQGSITVFNDLLLQLNFAKPYM